MSAHAGPVSAVSDLYGGEPDGRMTFTSRGANELLQRAADATGMEESLATINAVAYELDVHLIESIPLSRQGEWGGSYAVLQPAIGREVDVAFFRPRALEPNSQTYARALLWASRQAAESVQIEERA